MNGCDEDLLIGQIDFTCIGQVAEHCNWDQLCVFVAEQQNLTLLPKIGDCLFALLVRWAQEEIPDTPDQDFHKLFCGGEYVGCDGKTKVQFGLKRALVHWSYGAYIYRHSYIDTPFGVVQKASQDSLPAPIGELRAINQEQRNAGERYWQMTKDFICTLKDKEPFKECLEDCDCCCKCSYCELGGEGFKRGIRFFNITKN